MDVPLISEEGFENQLGWAFGQGACKKAQIYEVTYDSEGFAGLATKRMPFEMHSLIRTQKRNHGTISKRN